MIKKVISKYFHDAKNLNKNLRECSNYQKCYSLSVAKFKKTFSANSYPIAYLELNECFKIIDPTYLLCELLQIRRLNYSKISNELIDEYITNDILDDCAYDCAMDILSLITYLRQQGSRHLKHHSRELKYCLNKCFEIK